MTTGSELAGRVALITGATGAIGRAVAQCLLAAGAQVAISSPNPSGTPPGAFDFFAADVRDAEAGAELLAAVVDRYGRIDVVVNNAGGPPADESVTDIVTLNLLAPLFVSRAANRVMQAQDDGGAIVNIGSLTGLGPTPGAAAYGAAKAGLIHLTQTLAVEWAPSVRVNCVSADLHTGDDEATLPLGRRGSPADVADAVVFLASPAAAYVSGANLVVHGGGARPAFLAAVAGDQGT